MGSDNAHFHVGNNMPGCLPDSSPVCVDSASLALDTWRGDIRGPLDDLADDQAFLDADTRQCLVTTVDVEVNDGARIEIDGRVYWIEPGEGDRVGCELRDADDA